MPDREPPQDPASSVLLTEDHDGVRVLTLNRPAKLNALNSELTKALYDAFNECDEDEAVRAVVVAGSGRAFCAGADLSEFKDLTPDNQEAVTLRSELTARMQELPQRLRKPVVAAVQGAAVGGGAGLALSCDMTVVATDVKFGYPEITHSIVPAVVMAGLQRNVGRKLGFEMISLGRLLNATEMAEYGLANRVTGPDQVLPEALKIATEWAAANPHAMAATKSLYYRTADLTYEQAIRAGRDINTIMRGFRKVRL